MSQGKISDLRLDSLAYGGDAVGRHEGKVCFVSGGCPGDIATVQLTSTGKSFNRGIIEQLQKPSPHRVKPECPHVESCGGCQWQHVAYEKQIAEKQDILKQAIERIAKIDSVEPVVYEASSPYGYRVKARLHRDLKGNFGYLEEKSHTVVPIEKCPILYPTLQDALPSLSDIFSDCPESISSFEIGCDIQEPLWGLVIYSRNSVSKSWMDRKVAANPTLKGIVSISDGARDYSGNTEFTLAAQGESAAPPCPPHGLDTFWQANPELNDKARLVISECASKLSEKLGRKLKLVDIFSGSGNLTSAVSPYCEKITAIDHDGNALQRLKQYLGSENLAVHTLSGKADAELSRLSDQGYLPDLVLLDPPRVGFPTGMKPLAQLQASDIMYLSCNPTTLARDINALAESGYHLIDSWFFDFFPNTYHIESLVHLSKD